MPEAGNYLLANVGFSRQEQPFLSLQQSKNFVDLAPLGQVLTLRFDVAQRYCVGWGDMTTGERFACPESHQIEGKYEQCAACQQRTGFNPAFYHATSVSQQQEARNLQPHILYLAHFGPGITKVGISHAARGNSRLLEQGARSAIILDTFPTAHIARQYEAHIAALSGIAETIQLRKKIAALSEAYDDKAGAKELIETRARAEQALGIQFAKNDPVVFDTFYFPAGLPDLSESYDCSDHAMISGEVIGMLGSLLFCKQQDTPIFLPLKKYVGYNLMLSYDKAQIELPARQTSLF